MCGGGGWTSATLATNTVFVKLTFVVPRDGPSGLLVPTVTRPHSTKETPLLSSAGWEQIGTRGQGFRSSDSDARRTFAYSRRETNWFRWSKESWTRSRTASRRQKSKRFSSSVSNLLSLDPSLRPPGVGLGSDTLKILGPKQRIRRFNPPNGCGHQKIVMTRRAKKNFL